MNKKYIIGALVVVLVVWTGLSWGKKAAVAPQTGDVTGVATTTKVVTPTAVKKTTTTGTTAPKVTSYTIAKDGSYIVSYTDSGFKPLTLTISSGKSIKFVNNSNGQMSIASADVGGMGFTSLNQGGAVGRGGTFYATLGQGTWHYMNRANQNLRGTIVVK